MDRIPLDKVRECLERSGYLLESQLVRLLVDHGYFVEPNFAVRDPRTGKAREIDLIAEHYNPGGPRNICVKTYFVIEAINNRFPVVLLTPRPWSPNANCDSYIKCVWTPEPNPFIGELVLDEEKSIDFENLFSQYCVLTKKNSGEKELMASHPDDVYGSLLKLSEYVEDEVEFWTSRAEDKYWRLFFWQPMLVLGGQLVSAHIGDGGATELREATVGRLEFNWHKDDQPRTTVIEVLTEEVFLKRLDSIVEKDEELAGKVHTLRGRLLPEQETQ
jgi:hypothetical protein